VFGLGAAIRALMGGWDLHRLKKEIREGEAELASNFWATLDPAARFEVGSSLLEAEMVVAMSEVKDVADVIRLQEKRVELMTTDLEAAEKSLAEKGATKLDVARLAVNMQGMALGFLEDFEAEKRVGREFREELKETIDRHLHENFEAEKRVGREFRKELKETIDRRLARFDGIDPENIARLESALKAAETERVAFVRWAKTAIAVSVVASLAAAAMSLAAVLQ